MSIGIQALEGLLTLPLDMAARCMPTSFASGAGSLAMSSVLSVSLSDEELSILEAAALLARTNVNDFVRGRALEAAEIDVLARQVIVIPARNWGRFEAWTARPAREVAGIKELACRPSTWKE